MMESKVNDLFNACLKDEEFLETYMIADDDTKPTKFMSNDEKVIVASIYYGWLICKHGIGWEIVFC